MLRGTTRTVSSENPERSAPARRVPCESLDASENLPKEGPRQVAFGQLQEEVPGMPNEAPAGLEEPLLETRQRPGLDGEGQDQPAQEIAEVVGDNPEEQADLIGPEPVTGEPGPVGGGFALLDPLLRRPAPVVEEDDGAVRASQGRDDKTHARKEFAEVMLNLGDHSSRSVPGGGLILEAAVSDQGGVAGSAARPVSRSSMRRSSTLLAGRRIAYRTPRRSSAA